MPEIRMRPKHQLTLPAVIVREANIKTDDRLVVNFVNGVITITAKPSHSEPDALKNAMSFAGIGKGIWGDSHEEVMQTVKNLRSKQWER